MLVSILANYIFGILVSINSEVRYKKLFLTLSVLFNLGLLGYYKYTNFFVENINYFFNKNNAIPNIVLPLGISFFTFQAMSYVIDVYRNDTEVQKNPLNLALFISLFPQLIAGPIVRYQTIAEQINKRTVTLNSFLSGVERFCIGLFKKVLLANNVGFVADQILNMNYNELSVVSSWIGILCYTTQIYFDFSGYSDMAIGLGRMFGFEFLENFNYPYISRSITEFWRRWHISLSTWFKDYLYIPLGGNRKGEFKTYRNLFIVWILTGLWHGSSWSFVAWGLYYGIIIAVEKAFLGKVISKFPRLIQHIYTILIVVVGWVFFRIEEFTNGIAYLKVMFGSSKIFLSLHDIMIFNEYKILFIAAFIFSMPVYPILKKKLQIVVKNASARLTIGFMGFFVIFIVTVSYLIKSSFNPFIYFRF
jgi:alginate O-acetyltransferase complex protein AlgI